MGNAQAVAKRLGTSGAGRCPMTFLDRADACVVNISFHGLGTPGPGIDAEAERYFIGTDLFLAVLDEVREYSWVELSFDDGYACLLYTSRCV